VEVLLQLAVAPLEEPTLVQLVLLLVRLPQELVVATDYRVLLAEEVQIAAA